MLLLAHHAAPGMVIVATVDHGLRPESAQEAAFVASLCRDLGTEHTILPVKLDAGNLQGEARKARYAALDLWARENGIEAVATAHHADDQAETVLMRLNRGSGVSGLSGIRARTTLPGSDTALIRPVLSWRRAELGQIVAAAGIDPVQDPSNRDTRFDRVKMRERLAQADWLDITAIANSADHCAEAEAALQQMTESEWSACVSPEGSGWVYTPAGPALIRKRVVARILAALGTGEPRGAQIAALAAQLQRGEAGNLGGVLARANGASWVFTAEPPRGPR